MSSPDFDRLVENAFDFLRKANAEFKEAPKFSIIHFYAAVELFLKARLLMDHWSLVVAKDPDRKRFDEGDFVSVSFVAACDRLAKIVLSPLPDKARAAFDAVRKHRNQMVHFHHAIQGSEPDLLERVAKEQLSAWYHLHKLLTKQWGALFKQYSDEIAEVVVGLAQQRAFYAAKFEDLSDEIAADRANGIGFSGCAICKFEAARHSQLGEYLTQTKCLVCGFASGFMTLECEECEEESGFYGGDFECESCEHIEEEESVADRLNEFVATKDNYFDAQVPANCGSCDGYHTVIEYAGGYLCISCVEWVDEVQACEWCNEFSTGDMEDTAWSGCSHCDGRAGHIRDND